MSDPYLDEIPRSGDSGSDRPAKATPSLEQHRVIVEAAVLERARRISGEGGAYRVLQELGRGGNSAVYLVEAIHGPYRGVLFALKVCLQISDPVRLERFNTEIRFLRRCDHPSILRVFDRGEYDTRVGAARYTLPFAVTEYLPKTLRSAMLGGLTILEKTAFVLQLLSGLAYLAGRDEPITHRDIKPENIFVKGKSAVLGDFGLLKAGDGLELSIEDHVQGSTGIRYPRLYPTPDLIEYCKKRENPLPLSPKSDVFQLGLVIAELFTTKLPIKARQKPLDPIERDELGVIPGGQGEVIRAVIEDMLRFDTGSRPKADDLFDRWEGIFLALADLANQLDGRVFGDS